MADGGFTCTCPIVTHVAVGLIFEAGTHREIRRSADCPIHQCANCRGSGWVCERHCYQVWYDAHRCECGAPGMQCLVCKGSGIKDAG